MGSRCGLGYGMRVFGVFVLVLSVVSLTSTLVEAAEDSEASVSIRAQALSAISFGRATGDWIDIMITRWSTEDERDALVDTLVKGGNTALAEALGDQEETGWVRFDPRGGGGPGRDPRKTKLYYAREIDSGDIKEIILVTKHFIGYGNDPQAADGARLFDFPISVIILKFAKDDKGRWQGAGTMDVGSKIKFSEVKGRFVVDSFSPQPFLLKKATLK